MLFWLEGAKRGGPASWRCYGLLEWVSVTSANYLQLALTRGYWLRIVLQTAQQFLSVWTIYFLIGWWSNVLTYLVKYSYQGPARLRKSPDIHARRKKDPHDGKDTRQSNSDICQRPHTLRSQNYSGNQRKYGCKKWSVNLPFESTNKQTWTNASSRTPTSRLRCSPHDNMLLTAKPYWPCVSPLAKPSLPGSE